MYTTQNFFGKNFYKGELFQIDVEDYLPVILSKKEGEAITILVVGAWHGDEIQSFLRFGDVHVYAFEPNPTNFTYLKKRYTGNSRVTCFDIACGEENGTFPLYEATITGNDSLLEIKDNKKIQVKDVHTVTVVRLDSLEELKNISIDLLWADVQGYELSVLKGASKILPNIKSLFLEVNEDDRTYKGTTLFKDLLIFLEENNFYLAHKEIDPSDQTGNAFFLQKGINTDFFTNKEAYAKRLEKSLAMRKAMIVFSTKRMYRLLSAIVPVSVRATIKKFLRM